MDWCLLAYAYLEYTPSVCGLGDKLASRASVGAMQLFEDTFREILIMFSSCIAPQRMLILIILRMITIALTLRHLQLRRDSLEL